MNRVFLIGNIGQEPDTKPTKTGFFISFSLATSKTYKGERQTQWHKISAFGKLADTMSKYLHKGMKVLVEGELSYSERVTEVGDKITYTNIVAHRIDFLDKAEKKEEANGNLIETVDDLPF